MPDSAVARIAARQHGVIARGQLEGAGLGARAIRNRVAKGQFHRIHRGVYAVGHRGLSLHGRFMAAVLACGEGAVLSHGSAAVLWALLKPLEGPIHVSTPATSGRAKQRGIHLHRAQSLRRPSPQEPSPSTKAPPSPSHPGQPPASKASCSSPSTETPPSPSCPASQGGRRGSLPTTNLTTQRHNIPVTTVPRTIEDLRATDFLSPRLIRRAIRQAELKGIRLDGIETDRTRSDLEALFLAILACHDLPRPEVNVKLGSHEVDFLWRPQRLVVETDSWTYHRGSVAFRADHARDLDLRAAGYAVLRFSEQQLEDEPERVAADVAGELQRLSRGG